MKTHSEKQGTPEWLTLKDKYDSASEASSMMGCSKNFSRDDLLKYKATGQAREISKYTEEVIFSNGHKIEALARPFAVEYIGEQLFPVVGSSDDDALLTSFDGLTMADDICWECKQWNKDKAVIVLLDQVPKEDYWQVVQGLVVSRAEKCLYTLSDGTEENTIHVWKSLTDDDEAKLLAGWKLFNEDRANYTPPPKAEVVQVAPVLGLPAVSIQVDGTIALIDNLNVFGEALKSYTDNINKEPETDQHFADLEACVKTLKAAEEALTAAENGALAQATSIDTMRRTVELYRSLARENRLMAEKLVKTKKEAIRCEIIEDSIAALTNHLISLDESLNGIYMSGFHADFKGVIKGKRTITSLRSAANDELARAKLEANEIAEKIRANLKALQEHAADYNFLFNDLKAIINKENSDFVLLVKNRVAERKQQDEDQRIAMEAQIRKEEQDRIAEEQKQTETPAEPEPVPAPEPVKEFFPSVDSPEVNASQPVYVVTVTDKTTFIKAVADGLVSDEYLYINTDRLTEEAYSKNATLLFPGLKVTKE